MADNIKTYLRPILGEDISDDIIEYILTIKNEADYEEFMENIVDMNNPDHVRVYETLKQEQFGFKKTPKQSGSKQYRDTKISSHQTINSASLQESQNSTTGKGKKAKYVNFYSQDNKPGLRKGRHPCNCEAIKHELINNCTKCGRIVCEQEGSGPCLFCDNMVCNRYEMEVLNANTKESDKLYNHLMEKKKSKEWKRALEQRNRLIKTDQQGITVKGKVFDDQNDYFDMNSKWLNDDDKSMIQRKYAHNPVPKSRRDFKLALDFASRTVTVENEEDNKQKQNLLKGVNKLLDSADRRFPKNLFEGDKGELITQIVKLIDEQSLNMKDSTNVKKKQVARTNDKNNVLGTPNKYRIANNEFLESVDQGMCLSMHQPWASLLVAGIKIHEGRTWRTEHRGRLWIAAAAKDPADEEILACEEMYRQLYNEPALVFPKKYPTGCLLGCVFVENCLDQKEYQVRYPDGESDSPYVLICSNPVILPVFYPMQGEHKIFSLGKEIHRTAKAALMSSKWV